MNLNELINRVHHMDNLELLNQIEDGFIHLIYIDPPFYTQQIQKTMNHSYNDKWERLEDYIDELRKRIIQIYRILHMTGNLLIHCDYHCSHYIKTMCDEIFGYDNFRDEIIWKRSDTNNARTDGFGVITDSILHYSKSERFTFNRILIPLNKTQIKRDYKHIEQETGRCFTHQPLIKAGDSPKELVIDGKKVMAGEGKRFIWSQDTLDEKIKNNPYIIFWNEEGTPRHKLYLDEHEGVPFYNLWDDISKITSRSSEWLDYPTQKPEILMERLIKSFSNQNEIVADFYCGSGTTLKVADKMGRNWVGVDNEEKAVKLTKERLRREFKKITDF